MSLHDCPVCRSAIRQPSLFFLSRSRSHCCMLINTPLHYNWIKFLGLKAESPHGDIPYCVWPELSRCPVVMNRIRLEIRLEIRSSARRFPNPVEAVEHHTGWWRLYRQGTVPNCPAFRPQAVPCVIWHAAHTSDFKQESTKETRTCFVTVSLLSAFDQPEW